MFLTKCEPVSAFDSMWDALDKDFLPVVKGFFENADDNCRVPSMNINENGNEYILTIEMPGVSKKNVDVSLDGDSLTVTAEKVEKIETKGLLKKEIRAEKFRRAIRIGPGVNREKIKARMENGILKLTLPKKEGSVGRKIEIA